MTKKFGLFSFPGPGCQEKEMTGKPSQTERGKREKISKLNFSTQRYSGEVFWLINIYMP